MLSARLPHVTRGCVGEANSVLQLSSSVSRVSASGATLSSLTFVYFGVTIITVINLLSLSEKKVKDFVVQNIRSGIERREKEREKERERERERERDHLVA